MGWHYIPITGNLATEYVDYVRIYVVKIIDHIHFRLQLIVINNTLFSFLDLLIAYFQEVNQLF